MERPASQIQVLFRPFSLVMILWQFDIDKPKMGRLWMRFVNTHHAELVGRTCTKFVTAGGKSMVSDGQPPLLLLRTAQPALCDCRRADRLAIVAFQHLAVMGEWLAIEGKDSVRRIGG